MKRRIALILKGSLSGLACLALVGAAAGCGDMDDNDDSEKVYDVYDDGKAGPRATDCNAPVALGENIVANGGAEASEAGTGDVVDVACWTRDAGCFTAAKYDSNFGPSPADAPTGAGDAMFAGGQRCGDGNNDLSVGSQMVEADLSGVLDEIVTGDLPYKLSAELGGWKEQEDGAQVKAMFMDASGSVLRTASIGPVTVRDRDGEVTFLKEETTGLVPADTVAIKIEFRATRKDGKDNDGIADNLRLIFNR